MESVAISWLVASATSPLIAVLALWTIYVFHTYRRRWRTVDLFLLTISSQELVSAIFTFCFAILNLIHAPFRTPCTFTQWGQVATRTFQMATLTSMVVDRALTVRWPYRYRFSVRRNQIRYHIAVLALVSILMGVASIFAKLPDTDDRCHQHPAQWDLRYVVFLLSLYGALVVLWLFCMVQVEVHRNRHGQKLSGDGSFQIPECASPDLPSATGMNSPLDTQSSTGSTRALHRPSRQASRRPYGKNNKGTSDLRWPSVAFASLLCMFVNHVPFLVLMSLAAWHPHLWSGWHEPILAWLGLLEGFLIPLLLFCRDPALRNALRRAFQRRSGALSPLVGDDGPFQMYFDKDHFRKRGTFGSVTPIGIITNYRRTPANKSNNKRRGNKGGKYTLPGLHNGDSVLPKSCFLGGTTEPLSKLSCADLTSLEMWREEEEENFYATLSDDFSTFSCKSGDDSALSEDIRISEELYGGSFTTVANDDFEFHDTRPCGGEVKMKPALLSPDTPPPSRNTSFRGNIRPKVNVPKVFPDQKRDLFAFTDTMDDDQKDPVLFILPPKEWSKDSEGNHSPEIDTPPRKIGNQKSTSFSMNDLDLIHKKGHLPNDLEATFILPVKSESTMSLYRLNVEQDMDQITMTPSRSETNVNGDSGFGSGAQSTNPVWSGFLCRKPSDPFWNMRKPTAHASVTPTRNYSGVLHPRMRKIPWISAWKKLDENSIHNDRRHAEDSSQDNLGWKENLVYEANSQANPDETRVGTIDEELSDVSTPVYNGDYNLNIFAKESGVLMENAYGKIVRDDCGVQVNFYSKNVQYDNRDVPCGNKDAENYFVGNVESNGLAEQSRELFEFKHQSAEIENFHQPFSELCIENAVLPRDSANKLLPIESLFSGRTSVTNDFKCEPRLNGGHYENLFGTKENIFAQCDPYAERKQSEIPIPDNHLEKRNIREESFRHNRNGTFNDESVYGQLNKPERQQNINSKNSGRSPLKARELRRRESDNRGNRCGIKRRESRTRSDPRPNIITETNAHTTFAELSGKLGDNSKNGNEKNNIEIEMKNVNIRNELNPESRFTKPESNGNQKHKFQDNGNEQKRLKFEGNYNQRQNGGNVVLGNESKPKVERRDSRNKGKDISRERRAGIERRQSGRKVPTEAKDSVPQSVPACDIQNIKMERRETVWQIGERKESGLPVRVERKNSDKAEKKTSHHPKSGAHFKDIHNRNVGENRHEGLWVNAIPFQVQSPHRNKDEENGNSPRRESRKEKQLLRSPRKSNLPRRESDNKNEKVNPRVRRKVSSNRGKSEKPDGLDVDPSESKMWAKEIANRAKPEWKHHQGVDDFCKFRDKCEDNFSHIQNLNRETSSEREMSRLDQIIICGKQNGNIPHQNGEVYPFETFQENGRVQYLHNSRLPCDDNENCRDKKLAITDFL